MKLGFLFRNKQFQSIVGSHLGTTLGMNMILPVLPVFLQTNGFTESQIGLLMGITAVGALVVRPWVGFRIDTKGSRPAILVGQFLLLVATAGYLGAQTFAAFFGLRLLYGIALAFYGTGAVTFASSVESGEGTSSAIALYTLTTMLAIGLAMSVSQIAFDQFGFPMLVIGSLVLIGIAAGIIGLVARPIKPSSGGIRVPFLVVFRSKVVLATTVCQFAANFAFSALFTFTPLAALDRGIPFYSVFFISFAVMVVSSRFFVQAINNRLGLEKTTLFASLTMLASVLLLFSNITPAILAVSGVLFGLGFGVVFPTLVLLLIGRVEAANRGTSLSILTAAGDTGVALSASILGGVAEHLGYRVLFLVTAVILTAGTYYFRKILASDAADSQASYK
ncbi:MAG: MFS transporter [Negativicutes bacterium]|nr:MFS transporter [Negativicutes bacterium]